MAGIPFLHNIDLNNHQLLNAKLHPSDSAPSSPGIGTIWYDTGNDLVKIYDNTATGNVGGWNTITGDITGVNITAGDGLSGTSVNTTAGTHTQTLTIGQGTGITVNSSDVAVTAAQTGITSILNSSLVVGRDDHNQIDFSTDNQIKFKTNNETPVIIMKASGEIEATKFDGALEGNADTATALATGRTIAMTGDVHWTSSSFDGSGNVTGTSTIQADSVHASMINDDLISGSASALTSGLESTDEFLISDAGTLKNMDVSVLQSYLQSNLTFTTNTDINVNVANLTARLPQITESVTIGDATDVTVTTSGDLVVTGDLTVSGDTISANVATLNVEDKNITLNYSSGDSSSTANGSGITIQDAVDASTDATILWDASNDEFDFSHKINVTGGITGTLLTAAQGNVTSLGTLTTLTVDNVIINGTTIGHTGDTDLMTLASGVLTVAGEVDATSLDISGDADIDGTLEADAITVNGTALNTVIDNRIKVVQKTATIDVSELHNTALKCNITHGMSSNNLIVKLYDGTTFLDVFADIDRTDNNTLQITFASEPTNDIVVIIQEIIGDNIAAGSDITYPSS